jgi:hypothetical protein
MTTIVCLLKKPNHYCKHGTCWSTGRSAIMTRILVFSPVYGQLCVTCAVVLIISLTSVRKSSINQMFWIECIPLLLYEVEMRHVNPHLLSDHPESIRINKMHVRRANSSMGQASVNVFNSIADSIIYVRGVVEITPEKPALKEQEIDC